MRLILIGAAPFAIAILLGVIAYLQHESTLDPITRKCSGIFVGADEERVCRLGKRIKTINEDTS